MVKAQRKVINSTADIPPGMSETEAREFWDTHSVGEGLILEGADDPDFPLPPARPAKSKLTSIRLGVDLDRRLRVLAAKKGTPYQTLLKEFVLERVYEEEKRLGIV